ncbi:MAG: hypothetical protein CMM52_13960 [Rhodospirillaceae bacterium]|nr:hypothetical protein [Rhodospirillaceae bacterium]|tara:strand:- start:9311 stop:9904 length:594 start_codon:yes stop_codon:yes gene_type:complete
MRNFFSDNSVPPSSHEIGGTRMKERGIAMIQSLHAASEPTQICYGFGGVVLSSAMEDVSRGDRFQGRFSCSAGVLGGDSSDSLHEDNTGLLTIVIGPHRLTSSGPVRIQRLITDQFYRIALRCDRFTDGASGVGRLNLAFYSDPRFCEGGDFKLDSLDIAKIPMPSLYLEAFAGEPILNAKLQTLDCEEVAIAEPPE